MWMLSWSQQTRYFVDSLQRHKKLIDKFLCNKNLIPTFNQPPTFVALLPHQGWNLTISRYTRSSPTSAPPPVTTTLSLHSDNKIILSVYFIFCFAQHIVWCMAWHRSRHNNYRKDKNQVWKIIWLKPRVKISPGWNIVCQRHYQHRRYTNKVRHPSWRNTKGLAYRGTYYLHQIQR